MVVPPVVPYISVLGITRTPFQCLVFRLLPKTQGVLLLTQNFSFGRNNKFFTIFLMEETVTAENQEDSHIDEDNQIESINEPDVDSGANNEKEELSIESKMNLKLKSSYRQKYKRAWELDQELRGMSLSLNLFIRTQFIVVFMQTLL